MLSRKRIVMVSNAIKTHEESPCDERALQIEKAVFQRHARPPRPHRVAHRAHHTRTSSNRAPKTPCYPRAVSSARNARPTERQKKTLPTKKSRVTFHERLYSASTRTTRSPKRGRFALHKSSRARRTVFYT